MQNVIPDGRNIVHDLTSKNKIDKIQNEIKGISCVYVLLWYCTIIGLLTQVKVETKIC